MAAAGRRSQKLSPSTSKRRTCSRSSSSGQGFVFLSYSRAPDDATYTRKLARALTDAGIEVWYDQELASGDRWERVLLERVDTCSALVVVMSPSSAASRWVRLEVGRARDRGRPICPILVAGEPFPHLSDIQHEIVEEGQVLPSPRFVDRLRSLAARPVVRGSSGPATVVGPIPHRNPHFVGRQDLLLEMEANLYVGRSLVTVEALHGLGGVGKTQLASEYVHRRLDSYDLVAWLAAERPSLILGQLAALAPVLGLPPGRDDRAAAHAVVAALGRTDLRWLLVFDNAIEPRHILPWLPRTGKGHTIITSRRRGWNALGAAVEIDVLRREESIALLRTSLPAIRDDVAEEIAHLLGDLPLAIEQAAGYLAATGMEPERYLALLRNRTEDLLDVNQVPTHDETVATLWDLSQHSLHRASPAALQLLQLCAVLGPEPIPLDLFSHPDMLPEPLATAVTDAVLFHQVVGHIVSHSLATRSGDDSITIHRLLAAAIRRQLSPTQREAATGIALYLLYRHLSVDRNSYERTARWTRLAPHLLAVTTDVPSDPESRALAADLLGDASVFLGRSGRNRDALSASARSLNLQEELATADRDKHLPGLTAAIINHAAGLHTAGRVIDAGEKLRQAVDFSRELVARDREQHLPKLALAVYDYAVHLASIGDRDGSYAASHEAVSLFRELVARNPTEFRSQLAKVLSHHAAKLIDHGHHDEALALSDEAVAAAREIADDINAGEPDLLPATLTVHALHLSAAGRTADALAASAEAVTRYRELAHAYRDAHLAGLAVAVGHHVVHLADTGRTADALMLSEEAVALARDLVTKDRDAHLLTLAQAVFNHALRLSAVGQHDEEITYSDEAVRLYRELATINPSGWLNQFAETLSRHGARLADAGRHRDALNAFDEAAAIWRQLADRNRRTHLPRLAASALNRTKALMMADRHVDALTASAEAVTLHRELLEADPEADLAGLAYALWSFASTRQKAGVELEPALAAAREAIAHFDQLAQETDRYDDMIDAAVDLVWDLSERLGVEIEL